MSHSTFTLLRHGQISGPAALYGKTDIALNENGRTNMRNILQSIHTDLAVDQMISSPLIRCSEIAREFSTQKNIPLTLNTFLQEMDFGKWDGIRFDELGDEWSQLENFWQAPSSTTPPQGETLDIFAARVINAWQQITKDNIGKHQLIICHGGVIRIILAHILQIDWRSPALYKQLYITYASYSRIILANIPNAAPVIHSIGVTN